MKKFINDLEVIENGVIHMYDNAEFVLKVGDNLILRIQFESDEENKSHHVASTLNSPNDLTIQCYNFNSSLGEGILTPTKLGTLDNKDMFITFYVWTSDAQKGLRILSYNILTNK